MSSTKNIYVSQIMLNGGHFPKQQTVGVDISKKVKLNHPITFDYLQQNIFNYLDEYFTRFRLQDQNIKVLYYVNDPIIDMEYDSQTHVLIYTNDRQELKILSLLSSYEYVVSDSVTWFTYSPHQRLLSTVMSKNYFCYFELLGSPTCIKSAFELIQSFVDLKNSRILLLTKAKSLIIQQFVNDPSNLQPLAEVADVSHFAVYDDHLYFLTKGQLLYRNLKQNNINVLLIKNATFNSLKLHRESFEGYKYTCESLNCAFFCQSTLTDELTCGCPPPLIQVDKKCICPKDDPHCKMPHCAGFLCKNSKCLINNVRCNGVNDCGDNSDEIDCKKKCSSDTHSCRNKCFIKDAVCGPVDISVIDPDPKTTRIKRRIYASLIALVCLALLTYPVYRGAKLIYGICRVRRMNLNLHSQALEPFECSELLEVESASADIMLMGSIININLKYL
ncbi:Low-density lipoprotein receptor-related protein 4 [Thelohanellus kitauei]|uniref:Low-density lipoprotein receptor-related protein 4 n=1 Tax=Thelohanellus kitauei TaxID=669202 RepID=A0A0C2MFB7_THEKT|nr:Low-density lipoprotein receptor-related protein 4 [Thelohanellus kitauei]